MASTGQVKELRERTGAGMMDCKRALEATQGNLEKAIEFLREKGLAAAAKKAGRVTSEGAVEAYIHGAGRIGVLVEINCETDFVAKTDEFRVLCKDIAMQIAAAKPEFVSRNEVCLVTVEKEKSILRAQAINEGKPEKIVDKIVEGRIEKYFKEVCLLEQPFIKDTDISVQDLIMQKIAKIGENITIRRFSRFELGEGIAKKETNLAEEISAMTKLAE
jgi:elongation factor Ts